MKKVTLNEFLLARVHLGHKASIWNPKMSPFIYSKISYKVGLKKETDHIIDVIKTKKNLDYAWKILEKAGYENKKILFIGTKEPAKEVIKKEAQKSKSFYINTKWLGGTLTNWSTMGNQVESIKLLEQKERTGFINSLPKKEGSKMYRKKTKLLSVLGGLKNMTAIPDIVIIVDSNQEQTAVLECTKLNIPIIALTDTNCNPELINIPIPANTCNKVSIGVILGILSEGITTGQKKHLPIKYWIEV